MKRGRKGHPVTIRGAGNDKAVTIGGFNYPSIKAAAEFLGVPYQDFAAWGRVNAALEARGHDLPRLTIQQMKG